MSRMDHSAVQIYFLYDPARRLMKIGRTGRPIFLRMEAIGVRGVRKLQFVGSLLTMEFDLETAIHWKFSSLRCGDPGTGREWFRIGPWEALRFLQEIARDNGASIMKAFRRRKLGIAPERKTA